MGLPTRMSYEKVLNKNSDSMRLSTKSDEKDDKDSTKITCYKNAVDCLHFVFDEILHWSPYQVRDYLNDDLIKWLKIRNCINALTIKYPFELDPRTDLFYIAHILYPDIIVYNRKNYVLKVYKKSLDGEIKRLPKGFFQDAEGKVRLHICLNYQIKQKLFDLEIEDIYKKFSNQKNAYSFLRSCNLYTAYKEHYDNGLELMHNALPAEDRNELYYHFYLFKYELEKAKTLKKESEK